MIGDSAHGQISQGTWETRLSGGRATNGMREYITASWLDRESDRLIVARKRVTTVEPRGLNARVLK